MSKIQLKKKWSGLEPRTKKLAVGVAAIAIASIALTTVDINGMVQRNREDRMARNAAELMGILSGEQYLWRAAEDAWCVMKFDAEQSCLVEYDGDIATAADIEIVSIRETLLGWSGTWRLTYYDGTVESDFKYTQSESTGICTIESEAFPTHDRYTLVLTNGDRM